MNMTYSMNVRIVYIMSRTCANIRTFVDLRIGMGRGNLPLKENPHKISKICLIFMDSDDVGTKSYKNMYKISRFML